MASYLYAQVQWFLTCVLMAGSAGSGKSNHLKFLLPQLYTELRSVWTVELYKNELRRLLPIMKRRCIDLVIIRARDACLNPLQPVGNPRTHAWTATENLCRHLGLPSRAKSIIYRVVMQLYREYGVLDGKPASGCYPTWFDVYLRIRELKVNFQSKEAIFDRMGGYLESVGRAYRLEHSQPTRSV